MDMAPLTLRTAPETYESQRCSGAIWGDIDEPAVRKYLSARASGVLEQPGMTLASLAVGQGFARRQDDELTPTVAGCVLFGRHPEWVQPAWHVTALRISGRAITDPIVD